jgi:hypothetical protein
MYSKVQVRARVRGFRGDTAAAIEGVQRLPPHRGGAMAACSTGRGKGFRIRQGWALAFGIRVGRGKGGRPTRLNTGTMH